VECSVKQQACQLPTLGFMARKKLRFCGKEAQNTKEIFYRK
jgi:hypothetical protein